MSQSEPELHSIILNLNKNYSNNKGYDFTNLLNKQIALKPNSLVALYNGTISRSPIVIPEDTTLDILIQSAFPTAESISQVDLSSNGQSITPFNTPIQAVIPKGNYSKLTFCRVMCNEINEKIGLPRADGGLYQQQITTIFPEVGSAEVLTKSFPYQLYYEMNNNNFFLGLRYNLEDLNQVPENIAEDLFLTNFRNLDDNCANSSNVVKNGVNENILNREVAGPNWDSWALGNSPIRGLGLNSDDVSTELSGTEIGFSTCLVKTTLAGSGTESTGFVFGLNNTYFSQYWAGGTGTGASVTLNAIESEITLELPQVLLGAYIDMSSSTTEMTKQRLVLYCATNLMSVDYSSMASQTTMNNQATESHTMLLSEDLGNYSVSLDDGCQLTWEIYYENLPPDVFQNVYLQEKRRYYFRFLISSPSSDTFGKTILYDSKNYNLYLNYQLVESGYLFQQMQCYSSADVNATTAGLCPQFYFYNSDTNVKVINPRTNNLVSYDGSQTNFIYNEAALGYSYLVDSNISANINTSALKNIIGVARNSLAEVNNNISTTTLFNPNSFPRDPELGGLTQLGSDMTRYNIELNLPVRCFNTTEGERNDIGQTRTIIHNTNPVVADTTNLSTGLISQDLEPFNLKFLSLNNPREILLNKLNIQVRRAKTNELATEIQDTSVEIIVKRN